eukprot:16445373-Heterocapsa_arctica.AAC.1
MSLVEPYDYGYRRSWLHVVVPVVKLDECVRDNEAELEQKVLFLDIGHKVVRIAGSVKDEQLELVV